MMTKPIPKKLREKMEAQAFYHRCCLTGTPRGPYAKIEWHHNFETYEHDNKGRLNEEWCILPVLKEVHDKADTRDIREKLDWVMLNRADEDTLKKYSKSTDLVERRNRLNKIYGKYQKNIFILSADTEGDNLATRKRGLPEGLLG